MTASPKRIASLAVGLSLAVLVGSALADGFGSAQGGGGGGAFGPAQGAGAAGGGAAAGPLDPAVSTLTVAPTTGIVNDGAASAVVTVHALDADGLPISGGTVTFASTGTGNTLTQPSAVTDLTGMATGTLASTVAESKTINGSIDVGSGDVAITATGTVVFVSAAQTPTEIGTLTITTVSGTALDLEWAAANFVDGYSLSFGTLGGSVVSLVADTGDAYPTTYSHTGLTIGVGYQYWVAGLNGTTEGTISTTAIGTTGVQSPLTIFETGDLRGYWDAEVASSFTYSSGTVIAQWDDLSGNGFHLTPDAPGSAPSRDTSVGTLAAVLFDDASSDDIDGVHAFYTGSDGDELYMWVVASCDSITTGHQVTFFATNSGSNLDRLGAAFRGDVAGDPVRWSAGANDVLATADTTSSYSSNTIHVFKGRSKDGGPEDQWIQLDGAGQGTDNLNFDWNGRSLGYLVLGTTTAGSIHHSGRIVLVVLVLNPDPSEVTEMDSYLTTRLQ